MLKRICVITPNYPTSTFIERGAYLEGLVKDWEKLNLVVDILAPRTVPNHLRSILTQKVDSRKIAGNKIIEPLIPSFGSKEFGRLSMRVISRYFFHRACTVEFTNLVKPNLLYGQFLFGGGSGCFEIFNRTNTPYFIDIGESNIRKDFGRHDLDLAKKILKNASGVICVSDILLNEVRRLGVPEEKSIMIKNSVDLSSIHKLPKEKCRAKLGIPQDQFLVLFVGHFVDRKGPLRVLSAINRFNGKVKGVFLGRGDQEPLGENVYYKRSVDRNELNLWLNASDVFVLPTLAEGHCNAINEAVACGLPIVSSRIPEVELQLKNGVNGILIDPNSVDEIFHAIERLFKDKKLRDEYAKNNLLEVFPSESRAELILKWMESKL